MVVENRGIVKIAKGKAVLASVPIPRLQDDYILVKTVAVALNPTDWQTVDESFPPGTLRALLGCDAAGIVVEVGKKVTKEFQKGDRIAGIAHGGNNYNEEKGTFAALITLKGDTAIRIPPNITFEEAATLPCGITTVALGLYRHLDLPLLTLPLPKIKSNGPPILIYGGSSATGTLAIQFAKLSGLTVITTASAHNFELLKDLGADHVLDYHDPQCAEKIRALSNNSLQKVFDTIATPSTAKICADAMTSASGGLYVNLMGIDFPRKDVRNIFFLGYTVMNEEFEIEGDIWPPDLEDFELGKKFFSLTEKLLEQGDIKPHPSRVRHGLAGVLEGMQEMKDGKVSGVKLVYLIGDTE